MAVPGLCEFRWRCSKCRRTNVGGVTVDADDARQVVRVQTMCSCGLEHEMRVQIPSCSKGKTLVLGNPKAKPR